MPSHFNDFIVRRVHLIQHCSSFLIKLSNSHSRAFLNGSPQMLCSNPCLVPVYLEHVLCPRPRRYRNKLLRSTNKQSPRSTAFRATPKNSLRNPQYPNCCLLSQDEAHSMTWSCITFLRQTMPLPVDDIQFICKGSSGLEQPRNFPQEWGERLC